MLFLVGLGLYDDMTREGLRIAGQCRSVYLETYTSLVPPVSELEKLLGKKIIPLTRKQLEEEDFLIEASRHDDITLLVGGDPLVATTHAELLSRAHRAGLGFRIIHNASIYTAVAECGLQVYRFGKSSSIAFPQENFAPTSFYDAVRENLVRDLHTLLFLDVASEEERFMNPHPASEILAGVGYSGDIVVCSRLGREDARIVYCSLKEAIVQSEESWGAPPHALVVPARLHFMEEEVLACFRLKGTRKEQ